MLSTTLSYLEETVLEEFRKNRPRSLAQLSSDLGLSDSTALLYHIRKLLKDGRLVRPRKGVYRTVDSLTETTILKIPFFGRGKCGPDGYFLEDDPEYDIPISSQLIRSHLTDLFALEASGESMQPSIQNGDMLICRKQEFEDSNAMYVVINQGQVLIKKVTILDRESGLGVLVSSNTHFTPIPIDTESFRVVGKVVGVYHSL